MPINRNDSKTGDKSSTNAEISSSSPTPSLKHVDAEKLLLKEKRKEFTAPVFKENTGLILYYHPYNFYSQKVLFILYEKNIDVTVYAIDLSNGEQYSEWFLNLNPKADVPVLQDGNFIVTESPNIINYLENKFYGDDYKRLQPKDVSSSEYERIQFLENVFTQLPVGALSLGSFIHEELNLIAKPPFIGPIRKSCLKNNEKVYEILKASLEEDHKNKTALLRKLDLQERRRRIVYSRVEFQKILDNVHNVLRYLEKEMEQNEGHEWLVGNDFSLADISFGLLLNRLYQLGFENYYWSYGKMPHVESYFLRFKKRAAYQKLVPSNFEILKDIWQKAPANYIIGAGAGVLGVAMIAAFAHK